MFVYWESSWNWNLDDCFFLWEEVQCIRREMYLSQGCAIPSKNSVWFRVVSFTIKHRMQCLWENHSKAFISRIRPVYMEYIHERIIVWQIRNITSFVCSRRTGYFDFKRTWGPPRVYLCTLSCDWQQVEYCCVLENRTILFCTVGTRLVNWKSHQVWETDSAMGKEVEIALPTWEIQWFFWVVLQWVLWYGIVRMDRFTKTRVLIESYNGARHHFVVRSLRKYSLFPQC